MEKDPILEEIRQIREEYAASFGHDVEAMFRDLRRMDEQARRDGWKVVRLPPKRPGETDPA